MPITRDAPLPITCTVALAAASDGLLMTTYSSKSGAVWPSAKSHVVAADVAPSDRWAPSSDAAGTVRRPGGSAPRAAGALGRGIRGPVTTATRLRHHRGWSPPFSLPKALL